ncbi:MAG: hypothetical protein AAB451_01990, partial [Patescibacteria group bacterium]
MKNDKVIIKLKSLSYLGDSVFVIGDNEVFDIDKNIIGGVIYLSWIWKRYKGKEDEYEKLIAAWNAGRSVIPVNGPITFTKIKGLRKRAEAKQLV